MDPPDDFSRYYPNEDYYSFKMEMKELKKRFPERLVTQSLGSFDDPRVKLTYNAFMAISDNDVAQVHRYLDLGANLDVCHGPVDVLVTDAVNVLRGFDLNKPVLLAENAAECYRQLGATLGLSEGAVKVAVHRLRQRFRDVIRLEVAQTVATPEEVDEELHFLLKAMSA